MEPYRLLSRLCWIFFIFLVSVVPGQAPAGGETVVSSVEVLALEALHIERERQLWEAIKGANSEAFAALLAPEYLFVSGNGAYEKAATVKMMANLAFSDYSLDEFKIIPMGPDTVIVSYRASGTASFRKQEPYAFNEWHGSVWRMLREGKWLCVYHHFSPVPKR